MTLPITTYTLFKKKAGKCLRVSRQSYSLLVLSKSATIELSTVDRFHAFKLCKLALQFLQGNLIFQKCFYFQKLTQNHSDFGENYVKLT